MASESQTLGLAYKERQRDERPTRTGTLPSGEKSSGPVELRQALLRKKDEFVRHLTAKVLGYALGRGLQDGDQCTVQRLVDVAAKDNYRARTLIREIVLSVPFRNSQGGAVSQEPAAPTTHLRLPSRGEK